MEAISGYPIINICSEPIKDIMLEAYGNTDKNIKPTSIIQLKVDIKVIFFIQNMVNIPAQVYLTTFKNR